MRQDEFAIVVRLAPLISIDLIIRDQMGKVLVGRRNNEPAKNTFFVPGGVVRKDEELDAAFSRVLSVETKLVTSRDDSRLLGVFEHFYKTNRFGDPDYGTHYIVLAYEVKTPASAVVQKDGQHSELRWMTILELLSSSEVHKNTKAYFKT